MRTFYTLFIPYFTFKFIGLSRLGCTFSFFKFPLSLIFVFILFFNSTSQAQIYQSAVGVRLGIPLSVSYKKIFKENKAFEGYIGARGKEGYRWVTLSGAYLIHEPIDLGGIEELYYYYGGGASIYFWSFDFVGNNQSTTPGIQGYLGLEYTFVDKPINITFDWIPSIFISGFSPGFKGGYLGVGIRYVLDR